MTSLEKMLDAKIDPMMRKLDELLSNSNRENCYAPTENSRQATDEDGARSYAGPSRYQELALSLTIGRDPGQSRRGRVGQIQKRRRRRGTVTDNATSQISARSDYRLAGHNDVCFNV